MSNRVRVVPALLLACLLVPLASAQTPCTPPALAASRQPNIFTPELEYQLGELGAQRVGRGYRVIEDDAVTAYIGRIGARLAQHLPPNQVKFRFYVLDSGELNAYSFPGGRIYITRKLIATARTEDELAGVIGHEMGHELAGHLGVRWTWMFRRVLNVTELKDAADLTDKYHLFIDTYLRNPGALRGAPASEDQEQLAADQIGLYAAALSGYSPKGVADFWDRIADLKGRSGGWLSDLFGTTRPGAQRLREDLKNIAALPPSCIDSQRASSPEEFRKWQPYVVSYSGLGRKEQLHNVIARKALSPALREPMEYLRFSPDGKYVLAQDTASIYVLTREPFAPLFRIDANNAYAAQFTPDSQGLVFYNRGLRVEKWNIPERRMESVDEVYAAKGCRNSKLSPDGKYLACLYFDDAFVNISLKVLDTASGEELYTKKEFVHLVSPLQTIPGIYLLLMLGLITDTPLGHMDFSPDGRYLLVSSGVSRLGLDLTTGKEMSLPASIKTLLEHNFSFLPGNRLIGIAGTKGEKSAIVQFPSGEVIVPGLQLGGASLHGGSGDYVILGNLIGVARGLYNVKTKTLDVVSRVTAIDVYDKFFINEQRSGELRLYAAQPRQTLATTPLPPGPLGSPHTSAVSPDLRWLALSTGERGAVWDLNTSERVLHIPDFHGIDLRPDGFVANFPPERFPLPGPDGKPMSEEERKQHGNRIARFDLTTRSPNLLKEFTRDTDVRQVGPYIWLLMRDTSAHMTTLEVHDSATLATLWSRQFERYPSLHATDENPESFVLLRNLNDPTAKRDLKSDADLKKAAGGIKEKENSYLVEVLESRTGKSLGKFPVETNKGSFRLQNAVAAGDRVIFSDDENRVLLYSMAGERKGQMFGGRPVVSADNSLLCVEHEPGRLAVYDARSLNKIDQFTFGARVLYSAFSGDSKRLLVVTDDQTMFVLGLPSPKAAAMAK